MDIPRLPTGEGHARLVLTLPRSLQDGHPSPEAHRTTLGTLVELIAQASQELILAAPFLQSSPSLIGHSAIYEAVRASLQRGVEVHVFSLERNIRGLEMGDLPAQFPGRLHRYATGPIDGSQTNLGSHAKICVCDKRRAYVGSANLTVAGLSANVEVGLLVEGDVVRQLRDTWILLLQRGLFTELD